MDAYSVKVINLDNYIVNLKKENKFKIISLIKIDHEGLEAKILKSSKNTIIENYLVILFEAHGKQKYLDVKNVLASKTKFNILN